MLAESVDTEKEIEEVKLILKNMVQSVIDFCSKSGKITASEKRIIKAMKEATKDLEDDIIALYKEQADNIEDMTLLDVVNKNRAKILNDIYKAAITPKRHLLSKEAQEVINMVANDLLGHG